MNESAAELKADLQHVDKVTFIILSIAGHLFSLCESIRYVLLQLSRLLFT